MGENGTIVNDAMCFRALQLIQEWKEIDGDRRRMAIADLSRNLSRLTDVKTTQAASLAAHDRPELV